MPDYSPQPLVPTPSSTRGTSAAASTDVSTPPVVDAYTNVSLPDVIWAEPEAMMNNLHVASERPVDIDGAFNRYFERWGEWSSSFPIPLVGVRANAVRSSMRRARE